MYNSKTLKNDRIDRETAETRDSEEKEKKELFFVLKTIINKVTENQ